MDFKRVGTDLMMGGVAGVADTLAQNNDEKRATEFALANPGTSLPIYKQFGLWLNYVVPSLIVAAVATNYIKGDINATRATMVAGQLAGRKLTHRFTRGPLSDNPSPAPYTQYRRSPAAIAAAARTNAATRTYEPQFANAKAGTI